MPLRPASAFLGRVGGLARVRPSATAGRLHLRSCLCCSYSASGAGAQNYMMRVSCRSRLSALALSGGGHPFLNSTLATAFGAAGRPASRHKQMLLRRRNLSALDHGGFMVVTLASGDPLSLNLVK